MTAAGRTIRQSRRRFSGVTVVYWLISVLVVGMVGAWVTILFGHVEGNEFSPETLTRRKFEYYQVPLLNIQVWPIDRVVTASATEQFLLSNNYVLPAKPEKWDLVDGYQGATRVDPRSASILCAYFDAKNHQSNFYWIIWSQNHPQLAKILWPQVITVARLRCYEMIPDMMQLAVTAIEQQPHAFQTALAQLVADEAVRLGQWYEQFDEEKARALYRLALSNIAQHPGAASGMERVGMEVRNAAGK